VRTAARAEPSESARRRRREVEAPEPEPPEPEPSEPEAPERERREPEKEEPEKQKRRKRAGSERTANGAQRLYVARRRCRGGSRLPTALNEMRA
jgi:hypothetical protein